MDTIFFNGNIMTLNSAYQQCSAVAVKNGVIAALGNDSEILSLANNDTEVINLAKMTAVPGFTDSHLHFLHYAKEKSCVDLSETKSLEEAIHLCRDRVQGAAEKGRWIQANGFNQENWDIKKMPERTDLDLISLEVPVVMQRVCHHVTVCNTVALRAAGLLEQFPDGIVRELAQNNILEAMPELTEAELCRMISAGAADVAKAGITEVHTDDFSLLPGDCGETIMRAYRSLADKNELGVRIYEQCSFGGIDELREFLFRGHRTGETHGFFRVGPLKIIGDGSLGVHTAAMKSHYCGEPGNKGILNYSDQELEEIVLLAQEHGMQIAMHCIGDRTLEQALSVFRKVYNSNPEVDMRHGIVHCQIMSEEQQEWFKKLNLLAYIQPVFIRCDMHIVEKCVGSVLAKSSYNWRRFSDLGIHQIGGSDCPVEPFDILPNIQYAVTRKDMQTGKVWYPENGLTVSEALQLFTYEGAYASFSEDWRGTLSVGKQADITVIDRNIFEVPQEEIENIKVVLTMAGGKVTYRSDFI